MTDSLSKSPLYDVKMNGSLIRKPLIEARMSVFEGGVAPKAKRGSAEDDDRTNIAKNAAENVLGEEIILAGMTAGFYRKHFNDIHFKGIL